MVNSTPSFVRVGEAFVTAPAGTGALVVATSAARDLIATAVLNNAAGQNDGCEMFHKDYAASI